MTEEHVESAPVGYEDDPVLDFYSYQQSQRINMQGPPFYALIAAAMRQADSTNIEKLRAAFPNTWKGLLERHTKPGGRLPDEC